MTTLDTHDIGATQEGEEPFRRILLPTDFSTTSDHTVSYATSLARRYGAKLYLLHVIDETTEASGFYIPHLSYKKMDDEMKAAATKMLKNFCLDKLKSVKDYTFDVVEGIPYKEINTYAKAEGIDLIVMGSHGRSGIDRLVFGSTTERVLRSSSCPVLTVHPPEEASPASA
ncbi:MAG: universal stress protein [Thermodesulfobacteriota bacterium]